MTGNHPNLDLVNINAHSKFGQILFIRSQDIERETKFWHKAKAISLVQIYEK